MPTKGIRVPFGPLHYGTAPSRLINGDDAGRLHGRRQLGRYLHTGRVSWSVEIVERNRRGPTQRKTIGQNILGQRILTLKSLKRRCLHLRRNRAAFFYWRTAPGSSCARPTSKGLFNQPTVVNNVETLANLPFIMKKWRGHLRPLAP